MKVSVWMATRERTAWITAVEILCLGIVLLAPLGAGVRLLFGLPLLVHVGYKALTSLPMGSVPGRPAGRQARRNYELRLSVKRFLEEVKRIEGYAQQADLAGLPKREVEEFLFTGQRRVMAAAKSVAKETGRHVVRA